MKDLVRKVSDPTTRGHQQIMQNATDRHGSLWSYFLSRCSNRILAERVVNNHNRRLQGSSAREILEWAVSDVCDEPSRLFATRVRPQPRMRTRVMAGLSKGEFMDKDSLRNTLRFSLCPKKLVLKSRVNKWRSKQEIMFDLKTHPGAAGGNEKDESVEERQLGSDLYRSLA